MPNITKEMIVQMNHEIIRIAKSLTPDEIIMVKKLTMEACDGTSKLARELNNWRVNILTRMQTPPGCMIDPPSWFQEITGIYKKQRYGDNVSSLMALQFLTSVLDYFREDFEAGKIAEFKPGPQ